MQMVEKNHPLSPPQPVQLDYAKPVKRVRSRSSYIALVFGVLAAAFFFGMPFSSQYELAILCVLPWLGCAPVALISGILGLRSSYIHGSSGLPMSWVGVLGGGGTIVLWLVLVLLDK